MTFVVTESCIKCKHTECVEVCPADAFREGPNFLAIDPEACIDCALCVPECPVEAIFDESDLSDDMRHYQRLNIELAAIWEPIMQKKKALPEADIWSQIKDKFELLERE